MRNLLKLCAAWWALGPSSTLYAGVPKFDLTPQCAAQLLARAYTGINSRTRFYLEWDGSYLVTLSDPSQPWEIPMRRYTRSLQGGYDVTHYFDELTEPTHVETLPYFRKVEEREIPRTQVITGDWSDDDDSDVGLDWTEWYRIFGFDEKTADEYFTEVEDRLLVTDNISCTDLTHYLATAHSAKAAEILKRGLPSLKGHQAEEACAEAKEHLSATTHFNLTRDLDDENQTSFLMLRRSFVEMRLNHFDKEADRRAKVLLADIGCAQ